MRRRSREIRRDTYALRGSYPGPFWRNAESAQLALDRPGSKVVMAVVFAVWAIAAAGLAAILLRRLLR